GGGVGARHVRASFAGGISWDDVRGGAVVFTEAALLTIGAMMVVAAGLPMIGRLVEPARWGPRYPVPERTRSGSRAADVKRSFRPLDLGPDPVRWPSEIARPDLGPELPDWPSHHWDDPH